MVENKIIFLPLKLYLKNSVKRFLIIFFLTGKVCQTFSQVGFVAGPYVILPSFGSPLYGEDNSKLYNGTLGGMLHLDINKSIAFNYVNYRTLEEKKGSPTKLGDNLIYEFVPLRYQEINTTLILLKHEKFGKNALEKKNDNVNDGSIARAFGLRAGAISSQRMVQLTPNKFHWVDNNMGNPINVYDYLHTYCVTNLNQKLLFAGITLNNYKNKTRLKGPFTYFSYKFQSWVTSSHGNMDLPPRRRKWEQYFDIMYGAKQTYGNYGERGVYGSGDSVSVKGTDIPNIQNIGWRFGLRRVTFNHLGHSFIMEFGQYPGQKRDLTETDGEPVDSIWKNCFVFIGFNITIGHWFGGY